MTIESRQDLSQPKQPLQTIIYRNLLASSLIPILIIEVALLLMYFGINLHVSQQNQSTLFDQVTSNLQQLTSREAGAINQQLLSITKMATMMQRDHERFFERFENCQRKADSPDYQTHPNGAFYKQTDDGRSSLYYAATTPINDLARRKAACSEDLDPLLRDIVDSEPIITQAYLNTWDDMNRLYPFMLDAPNQYGPTIRMKDFNFYYLADADHNPGRGHVWTSTYLDPAGQGWMISNVVPVYRGDFLEGVSGLDVTIQTITENVLALDLPWQGTALLMDKDGVVLAMQKGAETILRLRELTGYEYTENIQGTVEKPANFNLLQHPEDAISKPLKALIDSEQKVSRANINGHGLIIGASAIEETGWMLLTMVEDQIILAPLHRLHRLSVVVGWTAVVVMVLFYFLFFLYLRRKSRAMARHIAEPIESLSVTTQDLHKVMHPEDVVHTGIVELDTLSNNFREMGEELERSSSALVAAEVDRRMVEKEKELFHKLATTDPLTGLANRRQLDDLLTRECKASNRYGHPLGVILMDVDFFKSINDRHGHDIGDRVLKGLAKTLTDGVRKTDTPGRWGGEEFLIICHETPMEGLCKVAETLRDNIESHTFPQVGQVTASFGLACLRNGEEPHHFVVRADRALYEAKENGRNRWVFADAPK